MDQALSQPRLEGGRAAIPLFRVTGIRISLDPSWFLIFALVFLSLSLGYFPDAAPAASRVSHWAAGLIASLLFFASILIHELAHSWVALRAGIPVSEITLFLFGGVSRIDQEPQDPALELRVAIVGPLMSFALALLFVFLAHVLPFLSVICTYLAWINLALGIFNLLPGYPLDGGRVLRALVWWKTGSLQRATRIASNAGQAFAIGLMILGGVQILSGSLMGGTWLILIALFLRGLARRGYEDLVVRSALSEAPVEQVMVPRDALVTVSPEVTVRELVDDYFLGRGHRSFPVVSGGKTVGLVSTDDVRGTDKSTWEERSVGEVMAPLDEHTRIAPGTSMLDALSRMTQDRRRRLLVMSDGEAVGLVSAGGILRFLELRRLAQET